MAKYHHCVCASRFFLQRFIPSARTLTDAETKSFISAADDDSDGKIGVDGWYLVSHKKNQHVGRNDLISRIKTQLVEMNQHRLCQKRRTG